MILLAQGGLAGLALRIGRRAAQYLVSTRSPRLEAIDMRHAQIGDADIGHVGIQDVQRLGRRCRRGHPAARGLQDLGHQSHGIRLIADGQHLHCM